MFKFFDAILYFLAVVLVILGVFYGWIGQYDRAAFLIALAIWTGRDG